jgi:hypothetical protein
MKTLFGAVTGALALGAVLVSYNLGEQHIFAREATPAQFQQMGQPFAVQAGQTGYVAPYAPYGTAHTAQYPYGAIVPATYPMPGAQLVSERAVTQPVARRVAARSASSPERVAAKPQRTWQKSALLIGGSAAGGAGIGALIGGKKGAGIGAVLGGGAATVYDQVKRR